MDEPTWIPRPDPALNVPLPVGVRPHCHPPNLLQGWVFLQHQVWIDYWGNEHEIGSMPLDYVANVIDFCEERAGRIRLIAFAEAAKRASAEASRGNQDAGANLLSFADAISGGSDDPFAPETAVEWLHTTPLLRALSLRLEGSKS